MSIMKGMVRHDYIDIPRRSPPHLMAADVDRGDGDAAAIPGSVDRKQRQHGCACDRMADQGSFGGDELTTLSDFTNDDLENAVKKAETGFNVHKRMVPGMVTYDFKTRTFGVVQRCAAPLGVMTFYQCTAKEIQKIINLHLEHPDWHREVNYS